MLSLHMHSQGLVALISTGAATATAAAEERNILEEHLLRTRGQAVVDAVLRLAAQHSGLTLSGNPDEQISVADQQKCVHHFEGSLRAAVKDMIQVRARFTLRHLQPRMA